VTGNGWRCWTCWWMACLVDNIEHGAERRIIGESEVTTLLRDVIVP